MSHPWRDGSLNRTTWALKNKPSHEADCAAFKLSNKPSGTHSASSAKPIRSLSQSASQQVAEADCREALWFSQQTDRASGGSDMRPARGVGELNSRVTFAGPPSGWPDLIYNSGRLQAIYFVITVDSRVSANMQQKLAPPEQTRINSLFLSLLALPCVALLVRRLPELPHRDAQKQTGLVANRAALQPTTQTSSSHGTSSAGPTWSLLQSASQRVA